jgi:hypothetical protein
MNDQPFIFTPEQEAWLVDLETTEEPQTEGALHRLRQEHSDEGEVMHSAGYCCLGRACVVLGLKESELGGLGIFHGASVILPGRAATALRLRNSNGYLAEPFDGFDNLTGMNDNGWTFKQIAAYIRANPRNVFIGGAQ